MRSNIFIQTLILSAFSSHLSAVEIGHSGHFRLRNENAEVYEGRPDRRNITFLRLRSELDFKIKEGISLNLTPQAVKEFGDVQAYVNDNASIEIRNTSGDQYQPSLDFIQAYAQLTSEKYQLTLGRQILSYGDNLVIGNRFWNKNGQSFDAIKGELKLDQGSLDLVYSTISEGEDLSTTKDDDNVGIVYYKILREKPTELDAYFIHASRGNELQEPDVSALGFRYESRYGNWGIWTENLVQEVEGISSTQYSYNIEAAYWIESLKLFANYSFNSTNYQQLYTNRHKYNGIFDLVGRRNLEAYSLGAEYEIRSNLEFKAQIFHFAKAEAGEETYGLNATKVLAGDNSQADVGQELDLILSYIPNDIDELELGVSFFRHGKFFPEDKISSFVYLSYLILY